jgi:hypothetical protein
MLLSRWGNRGSQGHKTNWKTGLGCGIQRLTPVILATQEAEIIRIGFEASPRQLIPWDPISKIPNIKKGLVEWLKVYVGPEFKPQYRQKKRETCLSTSPLPTPSKRPTLLGSWQLPPSTQYCVFSAVPTKCGGWWKETCGNIPRFLPCPSPSRVYLKGETVISHMAWLAPDLLLPYIFSPAVFLSCPFLLLNHTVMDIVPCPWNPIPADLLAWHPIFKGLPTAVHKARTITLTLTLGVLNTNLLMAWQILTPPQRLG